MGAAPQTHAPILIEGDTAFNASNGVVGGSGTPDDPFRLEEWRIDAWGAHGIEIRNTTASFLIRNVTVENSNAPVAEWDYFGVLLRNVTSGTLENVTVRQVTSGVVIEDSEDINVSSSTIGSTRFWEVGLNPAIWINRSQNLTLHDNAHRGTDVGILGDNITRLSITDTEVLDSQAIRIATSQDILLANSILSEGKGVHILDSRNVSVRANKVFNNDYGLLLERVQNGTITSNNLTYNFGDGLSLLRSENVRVSANVFARDGLFLSGDRLEEYTSHTITGDNLVNGRPLEYRANETNITLDGDDVGQLLLVNVSDVFITNLALEGTDRAILLALSSRANFTGNTLAKNRYGLHIVDSTFVNVHGNLLRENNQAGVFVEASEWVTLRQNEARENRVGFDAAGSSQLLFDSNTVHSNPEAGVVVGVSEGVTFRENEAVYNQVALDVVASQRVVLESNTLRSNLYGGRVFDSQNITILENLFADNEFGLYYTNVVGSVVYHNNFTGNRVQARPGATANTWDDGYPSGGNRWSDYTGVDRCSGPLQDVCPDHDGIGDNPYFLSEDNRDWYPLVPPNSPPVAAFSLSPEPVNVTGILTADASGSSDAEDSLGVLEVRWDWNGDGFWTVWSTQKVAQVEYVQEGQYLVRLEVRDSGWMSDIASTSIIVGPNAPPRASFVVNPEVGTVGEDITFDASSTGDIENPDERVLVQWDFENDGVPDTGFSSIKVATHRYAWPGIFEVRLTAIDSGGLTDSAVGRVVIEEAPQPPTDPPPDPLALVIRSHPEMPFRIAIPRGWSFEWNVTEVETLRIDLLAVGPTHDGYTANIGVGSEAFFLGESDQDLLQLAYGSIEEIQAKDVVVVKRPPSIVPTNNSRAALYIVDYPNLGVRQVVGMIASAELELTWVVVGTSAASLSEFYDPLFTRVIRSFEVLQGTAGPLPVPLPIAALGAVSAVGALVAVALLAYFLRRRRVHLGPGPTQSPPSGSPLPPTLGRDRAEPEVGPKYCSACGSQLFPPRRFCSACGTRVQE